MDSTAIGVAAGVQTNVAHVTVVNAYAGAVGTAPIGARINGIYLFHQLQPQAAQGNVDWYAIKIPGADLATAPAPGATGGHKNRKWILHEEKGIPGTFNNGASPLTFRDVLVNPPKMRRCGEDDIWQTRSVCSTAYDLCQKSIYKWIT